MLMGSAGCSLLAEGALDGDDTGDGNGGSPASTATGVGARLPAGAGAGGPGGAGPGPGPASATGVGGGPGAGGAGGVADPCGGCEAGFVCDGASCLCQAPPPTASAECPPVCTSCDLPNGLCIIERTAPMKKETIDCPDGMACRIECNGDKACQEAKLRCPVDQACEVVCAALESCKKAMIFGADGGVNLQCTGMEACKEAELKCGEGACTHPCPPAADAPQGHLRRFVLLSGLLREPCGVFSSSLPPAS